MANKLELTWVGKDEEIKVEPRILIENPELSNMSHKDVGQASIFDAENVDNFDNMLIHGDNLLALKALESKFAGQVKCIYIDPPYNTGYAFSHYDDNLEHSIWLSLMKPRLEIMRNLLDKDGSLWISIDDDEQAYLKVLCDEVFGRSNFVANCVWQKKHTRANDAKWFSDNHDFIMVYAKNKCTWKRNLLDRTQESIEGYSNPDNDPRGPWQSLPLQAKSGSPGYFEHTFSNGVKWTPPNGRFSAFSHESLESMEADNRIWFGKDGKNVPRYKKFLSEVKDGLVPTTIWFRDEVGDNQEAKAEVKIINPIDVFDTPKPERLLERVLTIATSSNDLVLDSFLGSGTTAAVAHKMGRRWIGVEMGEHAYTHCKVRLDKVIDGSDQGGITKSANWKGGGGYRFYELAPTLVVEDKFGNPVINKEYNADMLASAMALQEGFTYAPDETYYWKQGRNENAYIFTTTTHVTADYLASIHSEMQDSEFLVIACKTYDSGIEKLYKNITVKKIPQVLLGRCEFGKDDYSLNIVNMPTLEEEDESNN